MKNNIVVIALTLLLGTVGRVAAQDATLDRVQNLAATGRFTEARNTLDEWERQSADARSTATASDRARALYLRGTLTTDPKAAEEIYISVVLSHPSADVAPHALLRLGQGLIAAGEPRRALAYLERLRTDYPRSSARETGWLWLARAHQAVGAPAAACSAARDGLGATQSENLRILLELERDRACAAAPAAASGAPPKSQPGSGAQPAPPQRIVNTAEQGRFTVQTGAFRDRASADSFARELKVKGFDARVVNTEGNPLYRVRYGFFKTSADADSAARRVRDAGFTAIVVSDVAVERSH